jgi:hypothetical protein
VLVFQSLKRPAPSARFRSVSALKLRLALKIPAHQIPAPLCKALCTATKKRWLSIVLSVVRCRKLYFKLRKTPHSGQSPFLYNSYSNMEETIYQEKQTTKSDNSQKSNSPRTATLSVKLHRRSSGCLIISPI